ncbi:hypothetical protein BC939DRAFT_466794 [Gamsiella multidivaricata]|uniref:uncharacterized protein n=1 Tax=Gamsiella multidivaricata TaxID=101098 RepID=UPI002220630F|nr:uncharacterized protein BC939DRAFT_466794 [Gamsiella multidivaricata]KAI7817139.1 hypothetical protein BC939DRAFT_466794 [Gamsiella multidivaricata]
MPKRALFLSFPLSSLFSGFFDHHLYTEPLYLATSCFHNSAMGIGGLWPFLKKKGYEATMRFEHSVLPSPFYSGPMRQVDIKK